MRTESICNLDSDCRVYIEPDCNPLSLVGLLTPGYFDRKAKMRERVLRAPEELRQLSDFSIA
jgi:hypothetical protein